MLQLDFLERAYIVVTRVILSAKEKYKYYFRGI